MTFPTEERKYIISEICGDWSLHIKGPGTSNNFLFFKSRNNAELVKSILEWEDAHPNKAVPYKPTLTPPNEPLSIEQLREMDGKPVFLVDRTWLNLSAWGIVSVFNEGDGEKAYVYIHRGQEGTVTYPDQECGNCWLAYRRPPEGEDAK